MEYNISIDEPNINNESQNFELISNHSTENIIDKANTNDKTENIFVEFSDNTYESYYLTPNFRALNDDNIEASNSDFNLNIDINYDNTSDSTISYLASNFEAITIFTDNQSISLHNNNDNKLSTYSIKTCRLHQIIISIKERFIARI